MPSYSSWARDRAVFDNSGRGGVVILMYHKIARAPLASGLPSLYVEPGVLARQLDDLAAAGQTGIALSDAPAAIAAGQNGFCVTFDDGFRNVFDHALPILQKRGLRAMMYVVAGLIGATDEWDRAIGEPPQPLMDAAQLREWVAAGHEVGAHTLTHPHLTHLPLERASAEILESRLRLEDLLGQPVRHFCYPYGDENPAVREIVESSGFATATLAVNTESANRPGVGPLELGRVMACNPPSIRRATAARFSKVLRRLRR